MRQTIQRTLALAPVTVPPHTRDWTSSMRRPSHRSNSSPAHAGTCTPSAPSLSAT